MKNRADSVNFASYLAIETIEFVLFEDVVAQYFVGRNVGILNYIFRVLFRATLSLVVKNVEAIEHIAHFDTVFVCEHFASVEVFVGRKRVVGKILHDDEEKVHTVGTWLFRIVKRHVFGLVEVEGAIDDALPLNVGIGRFLLFETSLKSIGHLF